MLEVRDWGLDLYISSLVLGSKNGVYWDCFHLASRYKMPNTDFTTLPSTDSIFIQKSLLTHLLLPRNLREINRMSRPKSIPLLQLVLRPSI